MAASKLFSSVRDITEGGNTNSGLVVPMASSSTSVFNISVSLEENPQGDDDYQADPGASDDAQNKFEEKLEEFADAVFQMTNGAHKIGKVTIFRDGDQANNADIQWKENCPRNKGPRANPSGFGVSGSRIYFCTNWPGASTLMDTPKGAGFTLAHEWGHYAYGLYDEYVASSRCGILQFLCSKSKPRTTDTPSVPSIMNNQWRAARSGGDQDWLEFSTINVEPYATQADGDNKNAHARVFGENAWTTLTRSTSTDPKHRFLSNRIQYTTLTAPTSSDWTVNDDESTARSELDIIWAGTQVYELMIDTSGSMSGDPINNAKTAADLLVGQLTPGSAAVGVGAFTSSASQTYPITNIPDPDTGIRAAAQTAITNLSAGGGTNIQAAAMLAVNQTQAFEGGANPAVVFLLTDGLSSVDVSAVTSAYNAANVPMMAFGFGSGVDTALLQGLASGTGGKYFFSPTTLAEIQQAFAAANAEASSSVIVESSTKASAAGSTEVRAVQLDSTMGQTTINASYALNESDISLRLLNSSGADTGLPFTCSSAAEVSCTVEVDVATQGAGEYGVEIVNNTATEKAVSVLVSGTPSAFENYDIAVEFSNANYPEGFAIHATVTKGSNLTGLDVTAIVTKPDATTMELPMLDDGKNSDLMVGDGVYSVDVPYESSVSGNGTYTAVVRVSNASGNAQTTFENVAIALTEDGEGVTPEPENITENFTRAAVANATVSGADAGDDHTNDSSIPSDCTSISDDNIDTIGRIDAAGDTDCFVFTPSSVSSNLAVRLTSLNADIQPALQVFDSSGTNQLFDADLSTSENADSGVILTIPSDSLEAAGHVVIVKHTDASATTGGYAISVGALMTSDVPPPAIVVDDGNDGSSSGGGGGAIGPWTLLMIGAALMLFSLRRRNQI